MPSENETDIIAWAHNVTTCSEGVAEYISLGNSTEDRFYQLKFDLTVGSVTQPSGFYPNIDPSFYAPFSLLYTYDMVG